MVLVGYCPSFCVLSVIFVWVADILLSIISLLFLSMLRKKKCQKKDQCGLLHDLDVWLINTHKFVSLSCSWTLFYWSLTYGFLLHVGAIFFNIQPSTIVHFYLALMLSSPILMWDCYLLYLTSVSLWLPSHPFCIWMPKLCGLFISVLRLLLLWILRELEGYCFSSAAKEQK